MTEADIDFVLDKALLDSGYVKLNMRDHRDTARIFSVGGGGEDEHDQDPSAAGSGQADKVSSSPFSSFDAYVPGGSLKSTLEMFVSIPMTVLCVVIFTYELPATSR